MNPISPGVAVAMAVWLMVVWLACGRGAATVTAERTSAWGWSITSRKIAHVLCFITGPLAVIVIIVLSALWLIRETGRLLYHVEVRYGYGKLFRSGLALLWKGITKFFKFPEDPKPEVEN